MDVVVLAGGRGIRALPLTEDQPKALLPLAGTPLVEHVMGIYADQGFESFVVAIGHRGEAIERHFAERARPWRIRYSRAGEDAGTGRRLRAAADLTEGRFLATYGDGLADVDLHTLLEHHAESGRAATLTAVRLRSQYGTVDLGPRNAVRAFHEKPTFPDVWINGGFFVFEPGAIEGVRGESLEEDVLPRLAADGALTAFRHTGFWRSVDTFKDLEEISRLVSGGEARWAGLRVAESS